MNVSVYRFSLDIHKPRTGLCLDVKRGDANSRLLVITLSENGLPYQISPDCYAVFTAEKPDGKKVFNHCTIEGNQIFYALTPQTMAVAGRLDCEIKLYGADDALITSPGFDIIVRPTVFNPGDEIESETEVDALTHLISQATTVITESRETNEEARRLIAALEEKLEGGSVTDEQLEKAIKDYLEKNPVVGEKGDKGDPGKDGISPTITVTNITGGHRVTIVDKSGTKSFDVMDGKDGKDGQDGQTGSGESGADGFSPAVTVTNITGGHRVTITDKDGTKSFDVMDGQDGKSAYQYAKEGGYTGTEAQFAAKLAEESAGVYVEAQASRIDERTAENLLPYPYYNKTTTINGVTFTDNGDGSVTVNGTATALTSYNCKAYAQTPLLLGLERGKKYILSGAPEGSSAAGHSLSIAFRNGSTTLSPRVYALDKGGVFTLDSYASADRFQIVIMVAQGVTVNNAVYWPMLEEGDVMHEFRPYNMSRSILRRDLDTLQGNIPKHYSDFVTFYVNRNTGNDSNDGKTAKTAFASIEKAFEQANEGPVNVIIYVTGAGTYQFSRHVFASMTIHIRNISGGAVTLEQSTPGLTVFYDMHINSNGINWRGYYDNEAATPEEKWNDLYFEGCTVAMQNGDVMPHLKLIGGHVVATNVTCGGLQLSYCPAKLSQITVDMIEGVSESLAANNVGLYGMMSDIYCVDAITFVGNGVMDCVYQINNCELYMQKDAISGLASGARNIFVASTIYCTDAIKEDLEALCTLNSTDCIWECGYDELTETITKAVIASLPIYNGEVVAV